MKPTPYEAIEEEASNILLSQRVEEMLRAAKEIKTEVVRTSDGPGVKVITTDRNAKVESTAFGYKISTKDRNIRVIPNEYVKLTA